MPKSQSGSCRSQFNKYFWVVAGGLFLLAFVNVQPAYGAPAELDFTQKTTLPQTQAFSLTVDLLPPNKEPQGLDNKNAEDFSQKTTSFPLTQTQTLSLSVDLLPPNKEPQGIDRSSDEAVGVGNKNTRNQNTNTNSKNDLTLDSYGDPIDNLSPIITPDGRKVVSAKGVQFIIPNYASGITDIKKPHGDLLPPFIVRPTTARTTTTTKATTTTSRSTSRPTTTTTTTTQKSVLEPELDIVENPFDSATVPPWLLDFDYSEVGPGVPFVYNPEDDSPNSNVQPDINPPTNLANTNNQKDSNNFSLSSSSRNNDDANEPSKVALPIPSLLNNNPEKVTEPPVLFVPPVPVVKQEQTQAPFDEADPVLTANPLPADRESFPPNFNANQDKTSAAFGTDNRNNVKNETPKTESSVSSTQKFNPFLPSTISAGRPFGLPSTPATNDYKKASTASFDLSKTTQNSQPTVDDNLITSATVSSGVNAGPNFDFGGAKGFLSPKDNGKNRPPQPTQNQNKRYNWPNFGGPPGVLVPFDNTKNN